MKTRHLAHGTLGDYGGYRGKIDDLLTWLEGRHLTVPTLTALLRTARREINQMENKSDKLSPKYYEWTEGYDTSLEWYAQMDFAACSAVKYLIRTGGPVNSRKGGPEDWLLDLEKAKVYIEAQIRHIKREYDIHPPEEEPVQTTFDFMRRTHEDMQSLFQTDLYRQAQEALRNEFLPPAIMASQEWFKPGPLHIETELDPVVHFCTNCGEDHTDPIDHECVSWEGYIYYSEEYEKHRFRGRIVRVDFDGVAIIDRELGESWGEVIIDWDTVARVGNILACSEDPTIRLRKVAEFHVQQEQQGPEGTTE
jgi:hypothetical protein